MPRAALKPCAHPGCPELVEHGRCAKHQRAEPVKRDKRVHRLYDRLWGKRRAAWLAEHPWCAECLRQGIYTPATDVHHLVAHRGDANIFHSSPLESLCHACHSKVTMAEGRGPRKVSSGSVSSAVGQRREKTSQCGESS